MKTTENEQEDKKAVKEKFSDDVKASSKKTAPTYEKWKRRAYIAWAVVGIGLILMGLLYVAGVIWQAVAAAFIAILVTFFFHSPVKKMEKKGIPRVVGTCICMLAILAFAALVMVLVIPTMTTEIGKFAASFPDYVNQIRDYAETAKMYGILGMSGEQSTAAFDTATTWVKEQGTSIMAGAAGGVIGGVMDFGTGIMIAGIGLLCGFWFLIDLPKISTEIYKLVPEDRKDDLAILTDAFGTAVYGWLKATLVCAFLTGVASFIAFFILGVPYSALLAVICAICYVIPYIGPVISAILAGAVGLIVSPACGLIALIACIVIANVIGTLLAPRFMKNSVNLHPALVLLVILIGGAVAGIWGMLLSIPIAAALQGVFITYFEARTGRKLATENGALFRETGDVDSSEEQAALSDENVSENSEIGGNYEFKD